MFLNSQRVLGLSATTEIPRNALHVNAPPTAYAYIVAVIGLNSRLKSRVTGEAGP